MDRKEKVKRGRNLCFILRHKPGEFGLKPDKGGWFEVNELLDKIGWSREMLEEIVNTDDKDRYSLNSGGTRIRTHQGHSFPVDLGYEPVKPPKFLYQGTVEKFISSIRKSGLRKMNRHDVHLTENRETARAVGQRRGQPVILIIESGRMYKDGYTFSVTPNNVWLTKMVPSEYIIFPAFSEITMFN